MQPKAEYIKLASFDTFASFEECKTTKNVKFFSGALAYLGGESVKTLPRIAPNPLPFAFAFALTSHITSRQGFSNNRLNLQVLNSEDLRSHNPQILAISQTAIHRNSLKTRGQK
jgi:hypothetical protein